MIRLRGLAALVVVFALAAAWLAMPAAHVDAAQPEATPDTRPADPPLDLPAPSVRWQQATQLIERGRGNVAQAGAEGKTAAERDRLLSDARALFVQAQAAFTALEAESVEAQRKFPKFIDPKAALYQVREQARRDLLESRLALATLLFEIAKTHSPGSQGCRDNLAAAAKAFHQVAERYGDVLAGMHSRLWEGRCHKELGDLDNAFLALRELASQPDEPEAFRVLKTKAVTLYLETASLPGAGRRQEALAAYRAWADSARAGEQTSAEGLAIRHLAGKIAGGEVRLPEPATFAEARGFAAHAVNRVTQLERQWKLEQQQGNGTQEIEFGKDIDAARQEALKYYRLALDMAPADAPLDDLNAIRCSLTQLYWSSGELYEAAVMGQFVAQNYPDAPGARQGARIALAAYARLFNEAPRQRRQFEAECVRRMAEYVAHRWAGQPEAAEAQRMLTRLAALTRESKEPNK